MEEQDIIALLNQEVAKWANKVTRKLKTSAGQFTHGKEGMVMRGKGTAFQHPEDKLQRSIGRKLYYSYNLVDGVGFKIERHGVFVHKGVGRGYVMMNGMVVRGRKVPKEVQQYARKKNRNVAKEMTMQGSMRRHPVEWFNPLLDQLIPELADRIAEINADLAVNATRMKIQ